MKADRILVVMDGEIIEQGSHFDLIHAKGKYHDLWSKQIFVKPPPGNNERSGRNHDAEVVNDVTNTRSTVTLAKALKDVSCDQQDSSKGNDEEVQEGTQAEVSSQPDESKPPTSRQ